MYNFYLTENYEFTDFNDSYFAVINNVFELKQEREIIGGVDAIKGIYSDGFYYWDGNSCQWYKVTDEKEYQTIEIINNELKEENKNLDKMLNIAVVTEFKKIFLNVLLKYDILKSKDKCLYNNFLIDLTNNVLNTGEIFPIAIYEEYEFYTMEKLIAFNYMNYDIKHWTKELNKAIADTCKIILDFTNVC